MICSCKKKPERVFFVTGLVAFAVALITLMVGLIILPWDTPVNPTLSWGYGPSLLTYVGLFTTDLVNGKTFWHNEDPLYLLVVVFTLLSFIACVLLIIFYALRKQQKHIFLAICQFVAMVLVGYIFTLVIYGVANQCIDRRQYFVASLGLLFALISLLSFGIAIFVTLLNHHLAMFEPAKEEVAPVAAPVAPKAVEAVKEEKVLAPKKESKVVVAKPVEKAVVKPVAKPVIVPEVKPVEKPVAVKPAVKVAVKAASKPAPAAKPVVSIPVTGKPRRHVSFEEKIKTADQEMRQQYNELRDYIVSYGIHNRISFPGDTFSAHRERYVFVTVSGKHLKVNFALDPKSYADGTIPVDTNKAKKFEDLPVVLKVRSGLSFRRAKALVDDVMKKKGVVKPVVKPAKKS